MLGLGRLEEMQWWGRQAMLGWQAQQLRKMLQHAAGTVPHYQRVLPGVPEDTAGNIASILASLPILTKNELRESYDSLLSTLHLARKPLVGTTSGSTGKPLRVSIDRPAFARHFDRAQHAKRLLELLARTAR
jgi:phenylacetate-coenzyme A ligase PaaK-like adenylate-forming protein